MLAQAGLDSDDEELPGPSLEDEDADGTLPAQPRRHKRIRAAGSDDEGAVGGDGQGAAAGAEGLEDLEEDEGAVGADVDGSLPAKRARRAAAFADSDDEEEGGEGQGHMGAGAGAEHDDGVPETQVPDVHGGGGVEGEDAVMGDLLRDDDE